MRGTSYAVAAVTAATTAVLLLSGAMLSAAPLEPGARWNESRRGIDPVSGLEVLQLTTRGVYNQGPTVHLNTAFPAGGDRVIFASFRDGHSALMSGDLNTGDLTVHFVGPKLREYDEAEPEKTYRWCERLQGLNIAASPRHSRAAVAMEKSEQLLLIDLDTNRTREVAASERKLGRIILTPVFSADGNSVAFISRPSALGEPYGSRTQNPAWYQLVDGDGMVRTLYFHPWGQSHIFPNPQDPNLWIVKCGRPSFLFPRGSKERDASFRMPDTFILDIRTGVTRPIQPRNANKNLSHLSWNGRGDRIVYHGEAEGGGNYIGAIAADGTVLWEHVFREWTHKRNGINHIAADPSGDFIFDDGIAVPGQISLLDYRRAGEDGAPDIHPVAEWRNEWDRLPGQFPHPHPAVSPDGSRLVFYGARDGKVHVYSVDIKPLKKRLEKSPAHP